MNGVKTRPDRAQIEARPCAQCHGLFQPARPSQAFFTTRCRQQFHVDHGIEGTVVSVRRIHRGASIIVHLPDGPASEAAMLLKLKDKVRVVDLP